MELTEEQTSHRRSGGIKNYFYGGVTNVINLKLTREQIAVLSSGNQIGETIKNIVNSQKPEGYGK